MNSERSEGKIEMAKKMLKEKIDISTIIKISGLSLKRNRKLVIKVFYFQY